MRGVRLLLGVTITAVLGIAASGERPNFSGTWVSGDTRLVIRQDVTSIEMTQQSAKDQDAPVTLTCTTTGKECPMSDSGHKASVRVWYNGTKLVVFKTNGRKGDAASKRRLTMAPAGDSFEMEVMPIDPPGQNRTMVFNRSK